MNCRQSYEPSEEEKQAIIHLFYLKNGQDFKHIHELEQQAVEQKVGGDTPLGTTSETIKSLWKASPDGCEECSHTGFKGRIGIYEVLGNSVPMQKLIVANATSNQIQDLAIDEGMTTMQTDGLVKALRGNTTVEEVLRVTKE
ncbi:type IV-A pilus assembly ATPase PilB [compost metagenome]